MNPDNSVYRYYGGRGIQMCVHWQRSFEAFMCDVGPRPSPKHSLDRINNDGNYEPGNVRWVTRVEQARNCSNTLFIDVDGKKMPLTAAAELAGLPAKSVRYRLHKGWPANRLLEPIHVQARKQ